MRRCALVPLCRVKAVTTARNLGLCFQTRGKGELFPCRPCELARGGPAGFGRGPRPCVERSQGSRWIIPGSLPFHSVRVSPCRGAVWTHFLSLLWSDRFPRVAAWVGDGDSCLAL